MAEPDELLSEPEDLPPLVLEREEVELPDGRRLILYAIAPE